MAVAFSVPPFCIDGSAWESPETAQSGMTGTVVETNRPDYQRLFRPFHNFPRDDPTCCRRFAWQHRGLAGRAWPSAPSAWRAASSFPKKPQRRRTCRASLGFIRSFRQVPSSLGVLPRPRPSFIALSRIAPQSMGD